MEACATLSDRTGYQLFRRLVVPSDCQGGILSEIEASCGEARERDPGVTRLRLALALFIGYVHTASNKLVRIGILNLGHGARKPASALVSGHLKSRCILSLNTGKNV